MSVSKLFNFFVLFLFVSACSKTETVYKMVEADKDRSKISEVIAAQTDQIIKDEMVGKAILNRQNTSLSKINQDLIKAMDGHTSLYQFSGPYKILVIPVQFKDVKLKDPEFYSSGKSQEYLFGSHPHSMSSYYSHASLGRLKLEGEVGPIITVDKNLADYGEAVSGATDKNAKGLVVDALNKLKKINEDSAWWSEFDKWDTSDYDNDKNFHEPDGFIDAVVLVYAGKSQASCQRSFDTDGKRPASADVPAGPRQAPTVECFNRIWPHRWAISLSKDEPDYSRLGPVVEGQQRDSSNGLKISDEVFALDYNMQSEYSDLSTFIHEFGHSLTLPDVYSSGEDNSTGSWEVMSQNASVFAQEMSTYSKLSLGWISPKIIKQGEKTSAYLGHYNYVTALQREGKFEDFLNEKNENLLSSVPEFNEDVYRSIVVLTDPTLEPKKVVDLKPENGSFLLYSGKFDKSKKSVKLKLKIDQEHSVVSFDTFYHIETETNFKGKEEQIKVVTDYDLGSIIVNGEILEEFRLVSGDNNFDTLAEENPLCLVNRTLELRTQKNNSSLSDEEKKEFETNLELCQKPVWTQKSYDLKAFLGKEIEFEIRYKTDDGYTETGILVDNIKFGDELINFEGPRNNLVVSDFKLIKDGKEDLIYNQFYLMEYRSPQENYKDSKGDKLSYNMDNNIDEGVQSFFMRGEEPSRNRFRMVTYDYKPGVLVWYFNSKYDRNANDAASQEGKGYLLVLNSKIQEVKIPGIFQEDKWFDQSGVYRDQDKDEEFKSFLKEQRDQFGCIAYSEYFTYMNGVAPNCFDPNEKDYLKNVLFDSKPLRYRRERFNEYLPYEQEGFVQIDHSFRNYAGMRTGLSTFSPVSNQDYRPFNVYKEKDGKMILDEELTANAPVYKNIASFDDKENQLASNKKFWGDSVVVEKKGFAFKVASPSTRAVNKYSKEVSADQNDNYYRRPLAKVYFNWSAL